MNKLISNASTSIYTDGPSLGYRLKRVSEKTLLWVFLIIISALILFPLFIAISGSLMTNQELNAGAKIFPSSFKFENYATAWNDANFSRFTINSLFVATVSTIGTIIVASMAVYAVDRTNFFGKRLFILLQSVLMFISLGAVTLRPQFDMMVALGLQKSLWGVIIILISSHATAFFILLGYIKSVPKDLDESAMIDGAGFFRVYWQIVLPLLGPGLGVAALFSFRGAWNEYILPLVFTMTQPDNQTITVGLANLKYGFAGAMQNHLMLAGACVSMLPLLIVYLFANKSFMQMSSGALKG